MQPLIEAASQRNHRLKITSEPHARHPHLAIIYCEWNLWYSQWYNTISNNFRTTAPSS